MKRHCARIGLWLVGVLMGPGISLGRSRSEDPTVMDRLSDIAADYAELLDGRTLAVEIESLFVIAETLDRMPSCRMLGDCVRARAIEKEKIAQALEESSTPMVDLGWEYSSVQAELIDLVVAFDEQGMIPDLLSTQF